MPGWNPAGIGLVLTVGGVVGLFVQTPIGALIDRTWHKRSLIIIAAALTSAGAFMITIVPSYAVITAAHVVTGMAGAVVPPAIAAIALGLVGVRNYTYRTGRMAAFNHAGNVIGATIAGLAGYLITIRAGFWFASIVGIFVIIATLLINRRLINHDVARGLTPRDAAKADADAAEKPSGFTVLLRSRPLLVLCAAGLLWQLANGAMLPIMGQKLALHHAGEGTLFQAALIIVAQLVMIPMAILIARRADRGHKTRY
ncbi:MAG: MFS transporter [Pseudonocardiaceae bacterium]